MARAGAERPGRSGRRGRSGGRNDILLWVIGGAITVLAAVLLWGADALFFEESGVKANLLARAERLRGRGEAEAAAEVGRMLKKFLDASKHASETEVKIDEAGARRLAFTLTVPWSQRSGKKLELRGGTTARLAAEMLERAGAGGAAVRVEIRRRRREKDSGSEPIGRTTHAPGSGRFEWRPAAP
ncbi:MAG: hypothetical protein V3V62_07230 [bacterium]